MSEIIAITNSISKSESPWRMPGWIFTAAEIFLPAVNSFLVFHGFRDEIEEFVEYFVHFQTIYSSSFRDHIKGLLVVKSCHGYIFLLVFVSLKVCWSMYSRSRVPLVVMWPLFCSSRNIQAIDFFFYLCG